MPVILQLQLDGGNSGGDCSCCKHPWPKWHASKLLRGWIGRFCTWLIGSHCCHLQIAAECGKLASDVIRYLADQPTSRKIGQQPAGVQTLRRHPPPPYAPPEGERGKEVPEPQLRAATSLLLLKTSFSSGIPVSVHHSHDLRTGARQALLTCRNVNWRCHQCVSDLAAVLYYA